MSLNMKRQHILLLLGLTVTVLSFQNCGKAGLAGIDVQDMKPVSSESIPMPQSDENQGEGSKDKESQEAPDDYSKPFTGVCSIFKNVQLPIPPTTATGDIELNRHLGSVKLAPARNVTVRSTAGNITIESALNVDISDTAGQITIKSAQTAKIHRGAGSVKVAANEILSISGRAGALCLNAVKMGKLSGIAGGTKVIAKEIDEITYFAGNVHIYGAKVNRISEGVGKICLHDGATVLSVGRVAGRIEQCK